MADRNGYIGRAPSDSTVVVARQTFSPTGVTTDFTFASGYSIGYVDAYLNGARLIEGQDYTATDGSVVTLVSSATSGDVLELVAYKAFNVGNVTNAAGDFTVGGKLTVVGVTSASSANYTGAVSASSFNSSGNISAVNGTFTGNVSVAGTLTYEDVTNVDSIGIITARTGIKIGTAGAASTLSSDGSAVFSGIVTASGGFNLGISSAGTVITSGPVKTLNFVGTGNTFTVNGTTVDISIQGGASGGVTSLDITSNLFF